MAISACSNCGSKRQYQNKKQMSAGGGQGPNYLSGLGTFWKPAMFEVVVCMDCGLTRYFANAEAREKLRTSPKWQPI